MDSYRAAVLSRSVVSCICCCETKLLTRVLHGRYVRQKRVKLAKSLLYEGAGSLLKESAMGSGIDLATCFVKLLDDHESLALDEDTSQQVMSLFDLMDLDHAQTPTFTKYCRK